jgi:FAD/FMN-containing dehydrogenase
MEVDGSQAAVDEDVDRVARACRDVGAIRVTLASTDEERDHLWGLRRGISLALRAPAC